MKIWIKNLTKTILFIFVVSYLTLHLTYIMRSISYGRDNVSGIQHEEALDVICIGGSSTATYWKPLYAWKEYGMFSYNYAADGYRVPLTIGAVKDVLNHSNPKLLVLDMRSFLYIQEDLSNIESGIRYMTDSMDFGINRFRTVNDVMKYYDTNAFEDDNISYYFELIKYHYDTATLGKELAWKHIWNNTTAQYKGFQFCETTFNEIFEQPRNIETEERMPIDSKTETYLIELLKYLNTQDVDVLFVQGPKPTGIDAQKMNNYLGDIIHSYGYEFLNTNNFYDEMNIDFSKDFYNDNHVNAYGADKYTHFLANYIVNHYNIPDHSADIEFAVQWNKEYDLFVEKDNEIKAIIDEVYATNLEATSY